MEEFITTTETTGQKETKKKEKEKREDMTVQTTPSRMGAGGRHRWIHAEAFPHQRTDRQCSFFDVRVFNPFAQSYRNSSLLQCYRHNEMEKRIEYD